MSQMWKCLINEMCNLLPNLWNLLVGYTIHRLGKNLNSWILQVYTYIYLYFFKNSIEKQE